MSDTFEPDEVLAVVAGQIYPANRAALLDRARGNGAGDEALAILERIPDHDYNGPTAVRRALLDLAESDG